MKMLCIIIGMILFAARSVWAGTPAPRVRLETNYGVMVLELNAQAAPKTAENFLGYVREGFYNGTIFHRVIKDFMIQGGGLTENMERKTTKAAIMNEADNSLKNLRGTIAMARTGEPHSATSQFFINSVDNAFLDYKSKTQQGWGYCVFGKVVEGLDVVDKISKVSTTTKSGYADAPASPVIIERAVLEEEQ